MNPGIVIRVIRSFAAGKSIAPAAKRFAGQLIDGRKSVFLAVQGL